MFFCLFFVALSLTSRDRLRILRLRRRIRFGCVQCQRIPPSFARNGGERTGTFVTTNATFVQQLQELTKLFEAGHLSNQEYASAKAKVLSSIWNTLLIGLLFFIHHIILSTQICCQQCQNVAIANGWDSFKCNGPPILPPSTPPYFPPSQPPPSQLPPSQPPPSPPLSACDSPYQVSVNEVCTSETYCATEIPSPVPTPLYATLPFSDSYAYTGQYDKSCQTNTFSLAQAAWTTSNSVTGEQYYWIKANRFLYDIAASGGYDVDWQYWFIGGCPGDPVCVRISYCQNTFVSGKNQCRLKDRLVADGVSGGSHTLHYCPSWY